MNYVVFDLECTCWEKNDPHKQFHETIEIGAVLLNKHFEVVNEFNKFVHPTYFPTLSNYCTTLTTIVQKDTDAAEGFENVFKYFLKWIENINHKDLTLVSWGQFDIDQLRRDCDRNNVNFNLDKYVHINLKNVFAKTFKCKRCGLKKALSKSNILFEGIPHSCLLYTSPSPRDS